MSEQWLPVVGWEGYYEVSDMGRVRSVERTIIRSDGRLIRYRGRVRSPNRDRKGYLQVAFCRDGTRLFKKIHTAVLESFVGPRPEGMVVCHTNDVHDDNRLENLRWDTPSANAYEKVRNGLHHLANATHCSTCALPYDAANTYRAPKTGFRGCKNCRRRRVREYRARKQNQTKEIAA